MKNELISMVELIDQHKGRFKTMSNGDYAPQMAEKLDLYENYANFLNTPLNISMFVPAIKVGDKWEVLEMPPKYELFLKYKFDGLDRNGYNLDWLNDCEQYQTAKDNVIFEGCYIDDNGLINMPYHKMEGSFIQINLRVRETIQDLIKYKPTLTKKGLEVSGLNNK